MNTNSSYRQTRITNFTQNMDDSSLSFEEDPPSPALLQPDQRVQDMVVENSPQAPLPTAIIKVINQASFKYAKISCAIDNLSVKINNLLASKAEGIIPKHLEHKCKRLFTKESEASVRSTLILSMIDTEVTEKKEYLVNLKSLYESRYTDLNETIESPLKSCNLAFPEEQIVTMFDQKICDLKLRFLLTQKQNEAKIQQKHDRFLEQKEKQNAVATLSVKEVESLKKQVELLKAQVKTLKKDTLKPRPKPSKNEKGKQKPKNAPPKSTGTTKGKGGKPKNTTTKK